MQNSAQATLCKTSGCIRLILKQIGLKFINWNMRGINGFVLKKYYWIFNRQGKTFFHMFVILGWNSLLLTQCTQADVASLHTRTKKFFIWYRFLEILAQFYVALTCPHGRECWVNWCEYSFHTSHLKYWHRIKFTFKHWKIKV